MGCCRRQRPRKQLAQPKKRSNIFQHLDFRKQNPGRKLKTMPKPKVTKPKR